MKRALIFACTLTLLLGACSSASGDSTTSSSSKPPPADAAATTEPKGATVDVAIKPAGFEPRWAIVAVNGRVTFTNQTTGPQQIVFDNARDANGAALQSPPIAPGATWVWTADTFASFAYHSPQLPGVDGRIQVDPPAEP